MLARSMRSVLVLLGSALALFLGGSAWLVLFPPVPVDLDGAENLDARARHVRIPVGAHDGVDGWFIPPRNGAMVVVLHGYGRDHTRAWRYGGFLEQAGYGLLVFDFRSSRERDRLPTTLGYHEIEDARAALTWLRARPGLRSVPVGLLGESLGGSIALVLAAERPDIRAVIADGAFASGERALEDACQRWAHLPPEPGARLCRALGRVVTGHDPGTLDVLVASHALRDRPLYFIHALRDDRLSVFHPRALWSAAGGKDPLWIIPEAGHNEGWVLHKRLYETRARAFFDHHLLGIGAGLPGGEL
jgi:pimeloyl-ACP methyl ester carboxylesterase